uniref:Uncharacterized protein n=1 Tax=Cucumis melo TaxID=3656 RepID=A0A9I9EHD2_CUCME
MELKPHTMPSKHFSIVHQPRALQVGFLHLLRKRPNPTLTQSHPKEHASQRLMYQGSLLSQFTQSLLGTIQRAN